MNHLELTSNGRLFSSSRDSTIKLWQIETGKLLKSIRLDDNSISCFKLLNEDLVAIGLSNDTAFLVISP